MLFKVIVSEAFSAFTRQRKSKDLYKALLAMRRQQSFKWIKEYLEKAMTLYGTYSAKSVEEIVDATSHLHKKLANIKYVRW